MDATLVAMPDWTYRTVFQPLLFALPARMSRDIALGFMAGLARTAAGRLAIAAMGHMRPDPRLVRSALGLRFAAPVGLGAQVDPSGRAAQAFAEFGFGFIEVGPLALEARGDALNTGRDDTRRALLAPDPGSALALAQTLDGAPRRVRASLPIFAALAPSTTAEAVELTAAAAGRADALFLDIPAGPDGLPRLDAAWVGALAACCAAAAPTPVLLRMRPGADWPDTGDAITAGVAGLVIDGAAGGRVAPPDLRDVRALTHTLRHRHPDIPLIAVGGIAEPADALALLDAGATLIQVDAGLVYGGPGLPKRINEAVLHARVGVGGLLGRGSLPALAWPWLLLLSVGLLAGGLLTAVIAATRVVLPYDEALTGLSRAMLAGINPNLLPFMSHDRMSLAGTMLATAILYLALSVEGVRNGERWAFHAMLISAGAGFFSSFYFLGHGYFDPLHAFTSAVLLQLLIAAIRGRMGAWRLRAPPMRRESPAWRAGQWGQALLIAHGAGLLGAGVYISWIGMTRVFVPEDLHFLATSFEALRAAGAHLVPLIAHDRAALGGMLIAAGLLFALIPMWGFRVGQTWVWRALLAAGLVGYGSAIAVHIQVGYLDALHLAPALAGLAALLVGLALSRRAITA